ncbi:hypothetical protein D3Z53_17845 [Lachnospiraceae bacterium]|jgi:hypothetical protein|nr:nuclear transport factor 2 family protein [uncultured Schaedlerella sp.]EOS37818.1 hypothetical protein C808_03798 [Lachnospiraceae bacterium M18-1]MCI9154367.1 SnoaL-like domain-containing protein [Ruminococcus sp.]NBI59869.1 hypothetical protein [Lachnospiraceae bacterium]
MEREEQLRARYEDLKKRAQRVSDIQTVEKLFHTYLQYYNLQHVEGILSTLALDQSDVSVEEGYSEVYEGKEAVESYFDCFRRLSKKPGILVEQHCVCPVIELAGDGKTAKLVCFARGIKGVAAAELQTYLAGRYYVDFIKEEDGTWKIWHLHWFIIYDSEVKKGFMYSQTTNNEEWRHPELSDVFTSRANKPSTYWPVIFNPKTPYDYIPEAPEPYETYDGITALKRTRILQHFWDREKY